MSPFDELRAEPARWFARRLWIYIRAVLLLLAALAVMALVWKMTLPAALAHEWYPFECCSNQDCFALPPGAIEKVEGGWKVVATGEIFPDNDLIFESNGDDWHRCTTIAGNPNAATRKRFVEGTDGKMIEAPCLWRPMQAGF